MPGTSLLAQELSRALAAHGFIMRGGFDFEPGEDAPDGLAGRPARAVVLVGQAGAEPWPHFRRWRESQPVDLADPLDTWCREVIGGVAQAFGARAVSPSDLPYLPFQQWAMRAEGLRPSPLGILMHPQYGLWHAYRGALLFDERLSLEPPPNRPHLCDTCPDKPCLAACPVAAHSLGGFAYDHCLAYVRGPSGAACRQGGCLDRNACPYGTVYRYPAEVQAFHMKAFGRL